MRVFQPVADCSATSEPIPGRGGPWRRPQAEELWGPAFIGSERARAALCQCAAEGHSGVAAQLKPRARRCFDEHARLVCASATVAAAARSGGRGQGISESRFHRNNVLDGPA
jgi:hypothetical protein